jgi:thiol-disulfide isomerase/thioredoxin
MHRVRSIPAASLALALLLALVAAGSSGCGTVSTRGSSDQEGTTAPAFELASVEGSATSLDEVRGAQVTLLDFWATWCAPCIREMPHLQAIYNKYRHKGFSVVGIACDSDEEKVPEVVKERGVTYVNLIGDEEVTAAYKVQGYPTLFLLDADGRIVERFDGAVSAQKLDGFIRDALESSSAPASDEG